MNTSKKIALLALASFVFVGCKESNTTQNQVEEVQQEEVKTEIDQANVQTASMSIEGMHCEFGCAKSIEKKLAKLDGVQSVLVNFETKLAEIQYDATQQTPQVLAQAIEAMADGQTYKVSQVASSSDKSEVYFDQEQQKSKKEKRSKKEKKNQDKIEASSTAIPTESTEKKAGCCSDKKSCSKSKAESTM